LRALGADSVGLLRFDARLSAMSAEEFVRKLLLGRLGAREVWIGPDFRFGNRRGGDLPLLQALGAELGFTAGEIEPVQSQGERVSSTRIREAIRAGDLNAASQMLGREYVLAGTVMRGDALGTKIGFPTANLDVRGRMVPPHGVYAVHAYVDGRKHRAVVNIGVRPTVQSGALELRVEAHLLDFSGNLYDSEIALTFVGKLRDEQKFGSIDELRGQIGRDIAAATARF
jgi:riboflavin kinase/FMN adenylyltransferase